KLDDPKVDTEMILLIHRAHLKQKDRYLQALKNGIEFYSKNYGPYPYGTITLVDPAPGASEAGGMEYPTLFTSMTMSWMPKGIRMPEMVTIHEFGHGYWYGIVGSNEFEEAWLDEGINSYSEVKAMSKYYGPDSAMIDIGNLKIGDLAFQRISVIGSGKMDPIVKNSWEYVTGGSYGLNVYNKAALMLLTLEKWLGEDVMAKIMKTYYEKWKFRHPRSQDFVQVAEEVSGRDLKWFFDQALRSPDKLDYAIGSLNSEEVKEPEGIFDGKTPEAKDQRGKTSNKPLSKAYRNEVVAVRYGDWIFPQDILIVFENGEKIRETWDGRDRWKRFVYWKPVRLAYAQVDPDRKMVLDVNYTNNSKVLTPKRAPIMKYALGFMTFFQGLLSFVSL
ncbi:MAG: M1 family aminopeptidase, partial [Candidatus Aminicenantes bacterium]|nr:M1 family aminopeptidase [Candidatus Aminicenantes bacterium]